MGGAAMSSSMPSGSPDLSDASIDMSNFTVAYDFLQDVLVDSELQPFDDAVARAFWYGIVIVIVLAGIGHWARWATLKARWVCSNLRHFLSCADRVIQSVACVLLHRNARGPLVHPTR